MYIPSQYAQEYRTAIQAASRPYDTVYGIVTFPSSTGLPALNFDASNLPTNAITISKQCIDDNELMFGGVFTNQLKLSLTGLTGDYNDRYQFYGATIELYYKIEVLQNTFVTIPLGIYTVADADKPSDKVNLTAYDNMTLLDLPIGGAQINGTPWQMFEQVEYHTGMQLGFEEEDLEDFINYNYETSATSDRGLQTYRDVVKMICQQLGCFAYADRDGTLALKQFSLRPDISLTMSNWYSLVPADYKSTYIGLSITSLKGTFTKSVPGSLSTGLTMVIEDAPAWDYGLMTTLQTKTDNLFNLLRSIDEYTPCEIEMPSDACFDCGDRLEITLRDGTKIYSIVTSMEWKFHQGMSITSAGLNPYLEGGSALENATSRITNQAIAKSKLQFISFTNANEIVIADNEEKKIGECVINPSADTQGMFVATILCDIDDTSGFTVTDINNVQQTLSGNCEVTVFYKLGVGSELHYVPSDLSPYTAVETLEDGQHIITVTYPLTSLMENTRYEFQVWLSSDGGTITVPQYSLEATIFGQEITDISRFDGTIKVEENFPLVDFGYIDESELSETVVETLYNNIPIVFTDNYSPISVCGDSEPDAILDQNGDEILDQNNEPILGYNDILSPNVEPVALSENVIIVTELDENLLMRCGDGFYSGEDMATGLYNTLYDEGE